MNYKQKLLKPLSIAALFVASSSASAGLMVDRFQSGEAIPSVLGGYEMTSFASTNSSACGQTNFGCYASSVDSPISGRIDFRAKNGDPLMMERGTADTTSWWNNGEANDVDIFTTDVNWVKLILPKNTRAISFNVGSSFGATDRDNGWLVGFGNHWSDKTDFTRFNVTAENTPGFGVYAANKGNNNCASIKSIVIDPSRWGFGNLSINQDSCSVPEPSSWALLTIGAAGLAFSRRFRKA